MTFVAIVPVRGGSKGLPGKNQRLLGGIPLWRRAVEQGLEAGASQVIVTTDIPELLDISVDKVKILPRPNQLATDDAPMTPVVMHALEHVEIGTRVVLLQPTSPLRNLEDISHAVSLHQTGRFELVKSVTQTNSGILKYGTMEGDQFNPVSDPAYCFSNRQSLPDVLRPNGAVYVFDRDWFLKNGGFATGNIGAVVMPEERSHDIDTLDDFILAETFLDHR